MATCPSIRPIEVSECSEWETLSTLSGLDLAHFERAGSMGSLFFLVVVGGVPCGFFGILPVLTGYEWHSHLTGDACGRNGIKAAKMVQGLLSARGIRSLYTYVENNRAAQVMAIAAGFKRVGQIKEKIFYDWHS